MTARMKRDQCLQHLARHLTATDIVVPVFQAAFEWIHIHPSDLNYVGVGAMGQASSHGLGLALAFPRRRVIVIDGDGSLVMNLGTLITAAELDCPNFYHLLGNNGVYEANGSHPVPGAEHVDYCRLASAAGYRHTHRFATLRAFDRDIGEILSHPGPAFVDLAVERGAAYEQDYTQLHSAERRERFRAAVKR